MFDVIQSEMKVTGIENPTRVRISKPLIFFSSRHYGGQNKRRCAFAAIPLVQKLSVRDAKTKLLRTGFICALFFQPPQGCNAECIYIVVRGEKTKTVEVHGCFVRYVMIKGNRNSGPLSDCDRAFPTIHRVAQAGTEAPSPIYHSLKPPRHDSDRVTNPAPPSLSPLAHRRISS